MKTINLHERECVSAAVAVLGDKWTPRLIRALSDKTLRFCQLQAEAGGVNPRTLSARLSSLEAQNIIKKQNFVDLPTRSEYTLTDKGRELIPIIECMATWSSKYSSSNNHI
ncbi:MAG: hypothetical protein NVSMB46_05740 [Candidatus Saccharimonadales bacterium]